MKPLERKNYGSIPHLSNSKLGEGDHYIEKGMERILTKINGEFYDITGKVLPSFPETCFHKLETIADYRLMSPYNIYKNKQ